MRDKHGVVIIKCDDTSKRWPSSFKLLTKSMSYAVVFFVFSEWGWVRGYCSFCWYWWRCWPSTLKLSFHDYISKLELFEEFLFEGNVQNWTCDCKILRYWQWILNRLTTGNLANTIHLTVEEYSQLWYLLIFNIPSLQHFVLLVTALK